MPRASLADTTYFTANAGAGVGASLWRTDGSPAGTSLVTALPSLGLFVHAALDQLFVTGDGVWASDGTAAGTRQIANLFVPYSRRVVVESPQPGRVLIAASDATGDVELWESDGTAAGTGRLVDVNPFGSGDVGQLTRLGNRVLFSATDQRGFEPWISDGTSAGTQLLTDLAPGFTSSSPEVLGVFGSRALFTTFAGVWGTDGTAVGTQLPLPRDVTAYVEPPRPPPPSTRPHGAAGRKGEREPALSPPAVQPQRVPFRRLTLLQTMRRHGDFEPGGRASRVE